MIPEDKQVRDIADLKRQLRELAPSVAKSMNDVVASIVAFGAAGLSTTAFHVTATETVVASALIDIPEGFTTAAVMNTSSANAINHSTTNNYFYVRCGIQGIPGGATPGSASSPGYGASATASAIRTITGLTPGGQLSVDVRCWGDADWGSDGWNLANLNAIALFSR